MGYKVVVAGATGNVGREMLNILAERQFPLDDIAVLASSRSTGDVIDFGDTQLVNSIGISILLGIIDIAEKNGAKIVFSEVNTQTIQLFEMLGLTRHVVLAKDEREALTTLSGFETTPIVH